MRPTEFDRRKLPGWKSLGHALGVVLLSIVDACIPAALTTTVLYVHFTGGVLDLHRPLVSALSIGGGVFVATLGVAVVTTTFVDRPFPVTRTLKSLIDRWPLLEVPWP